MVFRFRSFNPPTDDDREGSDVGYDSDSDAVGYSSDETGLEMEAMLGSRRQASRTNSGTLLYTRGRTNSGQGPGTADSFCPGRGDTLIRAAYARLARRTSRRGSILRKLRALCTTTSRRPLSTVGILCSAVIVLSLFFNFFEGSYLRDIFGNVQEKQSGVSQPVVVPASTPKSSRSRRTRAPQPSQTLAQPVQRPRPATHTAKRNSAPTPTLSIQQHMEQFRQSNSTSLTNSFTTWLDSDADGVVHDVTPRKPDNGSLVDLCDTRGTSWYPSASSKKDTTWQLRAPAFLLPGAAYSGTVYLAAALHQHPSVLPARTKELQFFHERPFRPYVSATGTKTLVLAARERMYARDYDVATLKRNQSTVSFDATPGYLFHSTLTPLRILCVEPWVKLVVVLRNPVDRVLEHYAAAQKRGLSLSLEQWINEEFQLMQHVGLIPAPGSEDRRLDQKREDEAWYNYTTTTIEGGVGRSLYVIQIRHWINAFLWAGRTPSDAILIVRTDRLGANPRREYTRALDFLGLPRYELQTRGRNNGLPLAITHQTREVSEETRQRLEDFFRPYNQRLKRLLRLYGISSSIEDDGS